MSIPKEAYSVAAALLVGGAAGAAVGFWFGAKRTHEEYTDELNLQKAKVRELTTEVASATAKVNDLLKAELSEVATLIEPYLPGEGENLVGADPKVVGKLLRPDGNIAYDKVGRDEPEEVTDELEADPDDKDVWIEQNIFDKNNGQIHIINQEDFGDPDFAFTCSELNWYSEDGQLTDSSDELIDDPTHFIGEYALERFGWKSGDERIVYVRNERLAIDFEVTKVDGSFADFNDTSEPEAELRHSQPIRRFRTRDE